MLTRSENNRGPLPTTATQAGKNDFGTDVTTSGIIGFKRRDGAKVYPTYAEIIEDEQMAKQVHK